MKKQSKKVTPEQSAIDTYKMQTVDQMTKFFAPDVGRKTGNVMTQTRFRLVCETLYEQFISQKVKPLRYVDPIRSELLDMDEMELLSLLEKHKRDNAPVLKSVIPEDKIQIEPHLIYFDTDSGMIWPGRTLLELAKLKEHRCTLRMILKRIFTRQR